ncbi:MAG TPA: hypothetical protein VJL31_04785, partial [Gemmatimonadales bacterium]|nr:hypothetical protein [Gemmatimonadales bacterium]
KAQAGINVVHWDLRVAPLPAPQGDQGGGGGGFGGGGTQGPYVLPGQYGVALTVDGRESVANGQGTSRTLTVEGDPDIAISDADRRVWFETATELHTLHGRANAAADALNQMNQRMGQIREALRDAKEAPADLRTRVDSVGAALDTLRRRVVGGGFGGGGGGGAAAIRGRIAQLKGGVMNSTSLPTEVQMRQLGEVRQALPRAVEAVNALVARFTPLLEELSRQGVYPQPPKPIGEER